jgi:hypothetical protein
MSVFVFIEEEARMHGATVIERFANGIKHIPASVATRYETHAANYLTMLKLAGCRPSPVAP